jgi:DNA-binding beta-propeller fold protein YncE
MRLRLALFVLALAAIALAVPAGSQAAPEGGGGGDCPTGSNIVFSVAATPDLDDPAGIDVDAAGHVWVADSGSHTVYEFDQAGNQIDSIPPVDGTPDLITPIDVAVDASGRVYVADEGTHRVHRFNAAGVQDLAIAPATGQPDLVLPSSIALNPTGSRVWVTDLSTDTIQRFDTTTGAHTLTIPTTNADPDLVDPIGIAVGPAGDLAVVGIGEDHLIRFDPSGEQTLDIAPSAGSPALQDLFDVAVDPAGNIVALDQGTATVQRFSPAGVRNFVVDGVVNGGLVAGRGVTVGRRGDLWVTDDEENKVMRWCFRVDAKIRVGTGAFAGDTTVNGSGAGQTRSTTIGDGGTTNLTVRVDGESNAAHRVRVRGTAGNSAFRVRYFKGAQNVTAAVTGAGFVTMSTPGVPVDLRVEVHANPGGHATRTLTIRTSSEAAPARVDVVKAALTRT